MVLRLVNVLTDECCQVGGTIHTGEVRIEDELCHPRGRLNLGLENVRLQRIEEALIEQIG